MMYCETYRNLCHGTDEQSAEMIRKKGFKIAGNKDSWCGAGIYFYDIKKKAWWAAERKCNQLKKDMEKKLKPKVIFADIVNIPDRDIFDLRVFTDLCDFENSITDLFGDFIFDIPEAENETERIIMLRSLLISYYVKMHGKKLIIGNFRQRPQPKYEHAIEFANSLDMIFGIETIYCVKDNTIISNIH